MRSLFAKAFSRGLPVVIASTFLHVGVAAALVVTSSGHRAKAPATTLQLVDVDVTDVTPAPVEDEEEEAEPVKAAAPAATAPAQPTHTHPYEVPSHDAHPHDPSIVHDHSAAAAAEPAPVMPVAEQAAIMPRFTIALGNNAKPTSGSVVTNGGGNGNAAASAVGTAADAIVPESAVSTPAKLLSSVTAAYPVDARQNEIEADVPVEIVVDTHGAVIEARILHRAGSGLDESALSAIKRYRFTPAQRDGRLVNVRMRWSVQFRLR